MAAQTSAVAGTSEPSGANAGSALELFVAQPSLVGFETPSRMLLNAVRELFENALDSVSRTVIGFCSPRIHIDLDR